MFLFLVRHAHAVKEEENPVRPLSPKGREDARRVAEFLRAGGLFAPAQIWHSPLARSRETAEIFATELQLESALVETPDLLPTDEPEELLLRLSAFTSARSLAVVGHEPHLSALATLLVRGRKKPEAFDFRKGAVLSLERTDEVHKRTGEPRWIVTWYVTPALIASSKTINLPTDRI